MAPQPRGDQTEDTLLQQQCLYEILGVDRNSGVEEIRSAYRKQALKWHPDKIQQSGASSEACNEATQRFQAIARAYEVLADPAERAWYDSHRTEILSSSSSSSAAPAEFQFNLWPFFSPSAFSGFGESDDGFYAVYEGVFQTLHDQERTFARAYGAGVVRDRPVFGGPLSPYSQVSAFYNYWLGFVTVKDFSWCDVYKVSSGGNRKERRLMEEENKKIRRKARKEFNEAVGQLAAFVRKRDKRVMERHVEMQRIQKEKELMLKLKRQQMEEEKLKIIQAYEEQEWARSKSEKECDSDSNECDSDQNSYDYGRASKVKKDADVSNDDENHELYCIICGKKFRSEKQWQNHEKSKKHIERASALKCSLLEEDGEVVLVLNQQQGLGDKNKETLANFDSVSTMVEDISKATAMANEDTRRMTGGLRGVDDLSHYRENVADEATQSRLKYEPAHDILDENVVERSNEDSDEESGSGLEEASLLASMLKSHNDRRNLINFYDDKIDGQLDTASNELCMGYEDDDTSVGPAMLDLDVLARKPPKGRRKLEKRNAAALRRHISMAGDISSVLPIFENTSLCDGSSKGHFPDVKVKQNDLPSVVNDLPKDVKEEELKMPRSTKQAGKHNEDSLSEKKKAATNTVSQNEPGKKGKKKKGGAKAANTCGTCGEDFDTRNQLFKHISSSKHFTLKNQ